MVGLWVGPQLPTYGLGVKICWLALWAERWVEISRTSMTPLLVDPRLSHHDGTTNNVALTPAARAKTKFCGLIY